MNKFINVFILLLFIPTLFLSIIVGQDMPISLLKTTGSNFPYRVEIFAIIGLLMFLLLLRRSVRRWMGARIVSRIDRFRWTATVSLTRRRRVGTYLLLEFIAFSCASLALYILSPETWIPSFVLALGAIDTVVFFIAGRWSKMYRIGLSSKALIVADREVLVLYFTGLRKVTVQQSVVYFDYTKGLQLSFPLDCVPDSERTRFFELLESCTDRDQVYFTGVTSRV